MSKKPIPQPGEMQASVHHGVSEDIALQEAMITELFERLYWPQDEAKHLLAELSRAQKEKCLLLLHHISRSSPYLSGIATKHPSWFSDYFLTGVDRVLKETIAELHFTADVPLVRRQLRAAKLKLSFLIALADIAGDWTLANVTTALSVFAEKAVEVALSSLLLDAQKKNLWKIADEGRPTQDCGVFIFGMGKLGAFELNYSSDIDLIVFYDPEITPFTGSMPVQTFLNRMTQELVSILQERDQGGYVFRTDLRLRPDPASTPLAIRVGAALAYYETVGQNWERAAMIKARVIAGDRRAGKVMQDALRPFLWRRHLDFVAINDILSIKRQMQSKSRETIRVPGHHLKTGRGGIREIEFFVQLHQLIWGGRYPELRVRGTLDALNVLTELDMVPQEINEQLTESYILYRTVEHRLQMMADQQTHTIPADEAELLKLAQFCGFESTQAFSEVMLSHFRKTHHVFSQAFSKNEKPAEARLVFTGVDPDTATLQTLKEMGFKDAVKVSTAIMDWHKGNRRCTRTKRSREILTEIMPELLAALAKTRDPDLAFQRFDDFMERLPSGVQLFSVFSSNPNLLPLVADILGLAPALGETLSRKPHLLYYAMTSDFYGPLPEKAALEEELSNIIIHANTEEEGLEMVHTFRNEMQFRVGVHLLRQMIETEAAGHFLSDLADVTINAIYHMVLKTFEKKYGVIVSSGFGIIALGKLASQELMFSSDLDLMFIYDSEDELLLSSGETTFQPNVYYNRLAHRIIGLLGAPTKEGKLYDVDTRLRPFGKDGPLVVSLGAFEKYYKESAWVFERLALTRVRIVCAPERFADNFTQRWLEALATPLTEEKLREGLFDIRAKVHETFGGKGRWDIKHAEGGLLDCDLLMQYYMLLHYGRKPELLPRRVEAAWDQLLAEGVVAPSLHESVTVARKYMTTLMYFQRLCGIETAAEIEHSPEVKDLLLRITGQPSIEALESGLNESLAAVKNAYQYIAS